jgi:hypothetical protein
MTATCRSVGPAPARAPFACAAAVLAAALAAPAAAHEGHDHDAPAGAPASAGAPRFAAATELFELVGALEGRRLVLWLDRTDSNAPVVGATIELELGGRARVVRPDGEVYVVELDAPPAPGVLPVAATVIAGADADVFAAELRIEPPATVASAVPAAAARPAVGMGESGAGRLLAVGAGAALLAGLLGWAGGRRARAATGR